MNKRFPLIPYVVFHERWRGLAVLLFLLSLSLLLLAPPPDPAWRLVLQFAAALGALVFVLGFAMAHLAFVIVGQSALVVQLPLWRVKMNLADIRELRLLTLDRAAPGQWTGDELEDQSTLLMELKRWPQPPSVLRFWLGRLVLTNALLLPVDDVIALRRAIDSGLDYLRENAKS